MTNQNTTTPSRPQNLGVSSKTDKLVVERAWDEPGFCRVYYRVKEIHKGGEVTTPKDLLICSQEEIPDSFSWYTVCNDGCYFEPESEIKRSFQVVNLAGQTLKEPDKGY